MGSPTPAPLANASLNQRGVLAPGAQTIPAGVKAFPDAPDFTAAGTTNPHYIDAAACGVSVSRNGVDNNDNMAQALADAESTGYRRVKLPNSKGGYLDFNIHGVGAGQGCWNLQQTVKIFGAGSRDTKSGKGFGKTVCRVTGFVAPVYHFEGVPGNGSYVRDVVNDDGTSLIAQLAGAYHVEIEDMDWIGPDADVITVDQTAIWGALIQGGGSFTMRRIYSSLFVQPYKTTPNFRSTAFGWASQDVPGYPGIGTVFTEIDCFLRYRSNPLNSGFNKHCSSVAHVGAGASTMTVDVGTSGAGVLGLLSVVVKITAGAASPVAGGAKAVVSVDGGVTFGDELDIGPGGQLLLVGGSAQAGTNRVDGDSGGLIANFSAASLVVNDTYSFSCLSSGDTCEIIDSVHDWDGNYGVPELLYSLPQSNGHWHATYVSRGCGFKTRNYTARTNLQPSGGGGVGWLHFGADESDPAPFSISEGDKMLEGCGTGILTHSVTPSIIRDVTVEVAAGTTGIRVEGAPSISGRVKCRTGAAYGIYDETLTQDVKLHDLIIEGDALFCVRRTKDGVRPWRLGPNLKLRTTAPGGACFALDQGAMEFNGVELDAPYASRPGAAGFVGGGRARFSNTHFPAGSMGLYITNFVNDLGVTDLVVEFGPGNRQDDGNSRHLIQPQLTGTLQINGEAAWLVDSDGLGVAFAITGGVGVISGNLTPLRGITPYVFEGDYGANNLVVGLNGDTVIFDEPATPTIQNLYIVGANGPGVTMADHLAYFGGRYVVVFQQAANIGNAGNIIASASRAANTALTLQWSSAIDKWIEV